ncbi:MAG: hypothetical protein QOJ96_2267, partial [Alphaproteobacteria bacterium]|nr:hypothetical protein [Alphaproteobacteria bacterium]
MKVLVGALLIGSLLITPAVAQQAECDLPGNLLYG